MNKRGNILTENVIFIILTLVFLSILLIFVYIQSSPVSLMQQKLAKQTALLIDASKPGTEISLDVSKYIDKAGKNGISNPIIIDNENNLVKIQLDKDSYYEYGFFNNVDVLYGVENNYLHLGIR